MNSSDTKLFENIFLMSKREIDARFQLFGEGGGRLIYALDNNYVIKLSKFDGGLKQCRAEHYIYNNAQEDLKKYLCPVVWYKEDMLIMRKAIPFAKNKKRKNEDFFNIFNIKKEDTLYKNIIELVKTYDLLFGDIKSLSSWGLLDNQIVLIDYGCTNDIFDKYFYGG